MTSLELTPSQAAAGYRPLAGRVLLELEPPAEKDGSIVIPETARTQTPERTQLIIGKVLAIGFGEYCEGGEWYPGVRDGDLAPGDRVLVAPLVKDLNRRVLMTAVTRIEAVLTVW
jgi:co-chaperonin GroES (HSP10)